MKKSKIPSIEDTSAAYFDNKNKKAYVYTKTILTNQLKRDSLKIARSFDDLWESELKKLSETFSDSAPLIHTALMNSQSENVSEITRTSAYLLTNASTSIMAATSLLRTGYVLQPAMLLRPVIESIAIVFHIKQHQGDHQKYIDGKLQVSRCMRTACKSLPPIAQLYGKFSNDFSHAGYFHQILNPVMPYKAKTDEVIANFWMLKCCAWMLYVTAELAFNDLSPQPRYWRPVENGYRYQPSAAELVWVEMFLFHDGSS